MDTGCNLVPPQGRPHSPNRCQPVADGDGNTGPRAPGSARATHQPGISPGVLLVGWGGRQRMDQVGTVDKENLKSLPGKMAT